MGVSWQDLLGAGADEDDGRDGDTALDDLAAAGYLTERDAIGGETLVGLTDAGAAYADDLQARRADAAARRSACRNGLTLWLRAATSSRGLEVKTFALTPLARFAGDIFTVDEILDAATYLRDKNLLATGITASGLGGQFLDARLTHQGIDCADDFGGDVSEYLGRTSAPGGTGSIEVSGTGNTVQVQQHSPGAQQHAATNQAFSDIRTWADDVERLLPESGLTQADMADIRDQLTALRAELAQPAPNPSTIRVFGRGVMRILSAVKDVATVASAIATAIAFFG